MPITALWAMVRHRSSMSPRSACVASMVGAGVCLTFVICVAGLGYVGWSWDHPGRSLLAILFAAGTIGGVVVWRLPTERIIRSRWREGFFLAWSLIDLALIAALVDIDGDLGSPLALIFFVPVVFAAMSYPLPSVIVVGHREPGRVPRHRRGRRRR